MKRFLLRTLALVSFSLVIYVILILLFGLYAPGYLNKNLNYKIGSYGHLHTRLKEADTTKNIDILFLGSSHSYRGYDPRIFNNKGYKVFILGSSAQTPMQTEILLKRYLREMNPRLIVFDVHPGLLGNEGVESSLDLIANSSIDKDIVKLSLEVNNIKVYNTLMFGMFQQIFNLNHGFKETPKKDGDTYINGGYLETFRKYEAKGTFQKKQYSIIPEQMEAFNRIIAKLKEENNYILIQSPITKKNYESYTNNEELDSLFRQKGEYYNFNKLISLPDSLFFDEGHLNQLGVNIYNKKVIEVISSKIRY